MKIEGESTKLEAESIGGLDFVALDLPRGGYTVAMWRKTPDFCLIVN